jgi:hypothetical protein
VNLCCEGHAYKFHDHCEVSTRNSLLSMLHNQALLLSHIWLPGIIINYSIFLKIHVKLSVQQKHVQRPMYTSLSDWELNPLSKSETLGHCAMKQGLKGWCVGHTYLGGNNYSW